MAAALEQTFEMSEKSKAAGATETSVSLVKGLRS